MPPVGLFHLLLVDAYITSMIHVARIHKNLNHGRNSNSITDCLRQKIFIKCGDYNIKMVCF